MIETRTVEMWTWQKSSFSGGGDGDHCVEVADTAGHTAIRESDEPGVTLTTTPTTLAAWIRHLKRTG